MSYEGMTKQQYIQSRQFLGQMTILVKAAENDIEMIRADGVELYEEYQKLGGYIKRDDFIWQLAKADAIRFIQTVLGG